MGVLEGLLSEETLAGRGRLCQAELRPLAFSMLAELVHHARGHLSAGQLQHTVHLFSRRAPACPPARRATPARPRSLHRGLPPSLSRTPPRFLALAACSTRRHGAPPVRAPGRPTRGGRARRNLQDVSLAPGVDITSTRLLLNLVEVLLQRRSPAAAASDHRPLLAKILAALVSKLAALRAVSARLLAEGARPPRAAAPAAPRIQISQEVPSHDEQRQGRLIMAPREPRRQRMCAARTSGWHVRADAKTKADKAARADAAAAGRAGQPAAAGAAAAPAAPAPGEAAAARPAAPARDGVGAAPAARHPERPGQGNGLAPEAPTAMDTGQGAARPALAAAPEQGGGAAAPAPPAAPQGPGPPAAGAPERVILHLQQRSEHDKEARASGPRALAASAKAGGGGAVACLVSEWGLSGTYCGRRAPAARARRRPRSCSGAALQRTHAALRRDARRAPRAGGADDRRAEDAARRPEAGPVRALALRRQGARAARPACRPLAGARPHPRAAAGRAPSSCSQPEWSPARCLQARHMARRRPADARRPGRARRRAWAWPTRRWRWRRARSARACRACA